jgi:hypothetical protein
MQLALLRCSVNGFIEYLNTILMLLTYNKQQFKTQLIEGIQ